MMRYIETSVGLFIIAGIAALFFLAFEVSGFHYLDKNDTYTVNAAFDNIGDLKSGAAVTIAGVKVGQVEKIYLNTKTYKAIVNLRLSKTQIIPSDSEASILTAGLLGSNYVSITPGFSETALGNGSEIQDTHPAIILEDMIGQLLFSMKNESKDE